MDEYEEQEFQALPYCRRITCNHTFYAHVDAWSEEYFGCKMTGCDCLKFVDPSVEELLEIMGMHYG